MSTAANFESTSCKSSEKPSGVAVVEDRRRSDGRRLVKKGSLCETALLEAKLEAAQKGNVSEADRKKARRAANRLAAFQSRQRRKEIIADLQKTVSSLSKDYQESCRAAAKLETQIEAARRENAQLREAVLRSKRGASDFCLAHDKSVPNLQLRQQLLTADNINKLLMQLQHPRVNTASKELVFLSDLAASKQRLQLQARTSSSTRSLSEY
ncbi:hypothetical protein FisN_8Lh089 [Fistulifera solaris]|uniref:BZIP domain-containing protein n=1 Tax=Fistulifera solaris TaxID=1519565 RepID=A0A1Z5JDC5_FISSO|nr:hypothetical protein FisN_8Lh089 [Fistulifera solaris]|eukprot:GAX11995.1 hypothetical protein FisN_8Lh089 [Fistulifera solaris]